MANDKNKGGSKEMDAADKALAALLGGGDFAELRLDRTVYKPEECGLTPIVGRIIDQVDIWLEEEGRNWPVFIFRTTQPTKGVNREGDVIDVGVDEEILVTASAQILPVLSRYARDPEVMYEVALAPRTKVKVAKGEMWTWRALLSQKPPTRREGAFRLTTTAPKQLGTTSDGSTFDKQTGEVVHQNAS